MRYLKTILLSILILIVINYIIQFLKVSLTQPIIKYIPQTPIENDESETPDMKDELTNFLMSINI
jgi:ABC-type lipoprotein release transport system permease subunit